MTQNEEVCFRVKSGLGIITLNRPKALNALNINMCEMIDNKLQEWQEDDAVKAALIEGNGRAFCAGGDVKSLVIGGVENAAAGQAFFRAEYKMNARIFHFPKPYIAILDGVTMGGGAGISLHGSHQIVTENTFFAMPESSIGLIPDVGGSYFLPRLVGKMGLYLGLTGARLRAADMLYMGIGSAFMKAEKITDFKAALIEGGIKSAEDIDRIIARFAEAPKDAVLDEFRDIIDAAFGEDTVEDIIDHLGAVDHDFARAALTDIQGKSKMSLKLIFEQLRRGASLELNDCLKMEYNIVSHLTSVQSDFYRGVQAVLIDKTNDPKWQPERLEDVSSVSVAGHFKIVSEGELIL